MFQYPKRLIEVDLPIKRISAHARREKSIRHGHISTLHIWWARRPLAACRAVTCAALWLDPVDELCPQEFRDKATALIMAFAQKAAYNSKNCSDESYSRWQGLVKGRIELDANNPKHWNVLRYSLLDFIADFANWDNSTHEDYLETSRALTQAAHEALGGLPGTRPLVVDPFAGGGSIPLEALRVGADAFASDVNPVAVLLNRVVLEYIPKYGQKLADEVKKWGRWVKEEAKKELAEFYPKDPDGSTPIAYLWARTILSESPDQEEFPVEVPLLRSLWLSKRTGFKRAIRWVRDANDKVLTAGGVRLNSDGSLRNVRRPILEIFEPVKDTDVEDGTSKGGAATCPVTQYTTPAKNVRKQLTLQKGGAGYSRLYAVYIEKDQTRRFRLSNTYDLDYVDKTNCFVDKLILEQESIFPNEPINPIRPYKNTRGLSAVTRIGCETFGDLYNKRQALSIKVFFDKVKSIPYIEGNTGVEKDFLTAIKTLLVIAASKAVAQNTSVSRWDPTRLTIKGAFSKQALAVVWDFAEANPFSGGSAGWDISINWILWFISSTSRINSIGQTIQCSATEKYLPVDSVSAFITDPPYFAAIPYADLSDFFYVWLKRALKSEYPDLFNLSLTEKTQELIVTNAQLSEKDKVKDEKYFREGMTIALKNARLAAMSASIGVIVYAEATTAGWEAILNAIIAAGWIITASWPIDTEMASRTRAKGTASLQSSVHIVCRPRENNDDSHQLEIGNWRDVLQELPQRIHQWMPRLASEGVVSADAIFACLGPALEFFSRYSSVEKANGELVTLKDYLEYVWGAVSKEALGMIFDDADTTGFEEDARLTAMWLWTLSTGNLDTNTKASDEDTDKVTKSTGYTLEFDAARKIAQGLGAHLDKLTNLVEIKGDKACLLPVSERGVALFGKADLNAPTGRKKKKKDKQLDIFTVLNEEEQGDSGQWSDPDVPQVGKTVLDQVHQSMILFAAGRSEALKRFLVEDGIGNDQRYWKLAQALSALYPMGTDEKRWVDGVLARKKGLGF